MKNTYQTSFSLLKALNKIAVVFLFLAVVGAKESFTQSVTSRKVPFTFTLSNKAATSAGVFKKDGTLIRTLWSGRSYQAGTTREYWDRLDDAGRLVDDGDFDIRVLSNNVAYQWEGIIGNTSTSNAGNGVHRWTDRIYDIRVIGNYAYFVTGYAEGQPSQRKFKLSTPGVMEEIWTNPDDIKGSGLMSYALCNDENNIYWGGNHPQYGTSCVWATSIATGAEVKFSAGVSFNNSAYGRSYASIINVVNNTTQGSQTNGITGVAVSNSYLFVARPNMNSVQVLNKSTGALVKSLTYTKPRSLYVDGSGKLWMIQSGQVTKHTINSDGTLSAPILTIASLSDPLSLHVSPDNNTVLIGDGGANHVYKGFSNATGQLLWTIGKPGGYSTSTEVTYDKFSFRAGKEWRTGRDSFDATCGTILPDGSMWLADMGNQRMIRFAANRSTVLDELMNMGYTYEVSIVRNAPNRVFCNYLEFEVDYTKPLQDKNGSWKLKRNWSWNTIASKDNQYYRTRNMVVLSNGRTYNLVRYGNTMEIVEYAPAGMRYTGVIFQITNELFTLYQDGSLWTVTNGGVGQAIEYRRRPLTGFDSNNNPLFGPAVVVEKTPTVTTDDPVGHAMGGWNTNQYTSSNVMATLSTDNGVQLGDQLRGLGYHLGGLKNGKWLWRTAKATTKNYMGAFPADGSYDIGNGVQYGGNLVTALDRNIFWGYNGEFWKNSQTNKYNHVYDNGLFVGQFGVAGTDTDGTAAFPGYAGNAIVWGIVKVGVDYYLYHSDESLHGGIHRWKISNLSSISEQITGVNLNTASGTNSLVTSDNRGLTAQYFNGSDLNNLYIKTTKVDPTINFDWKTSVPGGTSITDPANFSVRWEGYVQPTFSENYTFSLNTYDGVRLWIDGKPLITNWTNQALNTYSGSVQLEAGKRYPIRIEYINKNSTAGISLSWSSARQTKQVIPAANLFPADLPDRSTGFALMEGLDFDNTLVNGMYGWTRNPTVDRLVSYTDYWRVLTNNQTVDRTNPDLLVDLVPGSNGLTTTVTRDLGNPVNVTEWSLTGKLMWLRDTWDHTNTTDKGYFEVLDANGKTIARFNRVFDPYPTTKLYANNKVLIQSNGGLDVFNMTSIMQPFSIKATSTGLIFQYGTLPAVATTVMDPTSKWQQPKSVRVFYYSQTNREHVINIADLRFLAKQTTGNNGSRLAAEKVEFVVFPNPTQDKLFVQYPSTDDAERSLVLFSAQGKEIKSVTLDRNNTNTTLDVSNLPEGMYILRYKDTISVLTTKFIKY